MFRIGFLTIQITPETPKIGDLLKTTCSSDDEGLEDHGVEVIYKFLYYLFNLILKLVISLFN